jgi:hypothetical protein
MEIIPYKSVCSIEFGANERAIVSILGVPLKRTINRRKENEFHYENAVYRLAEDSGFVECSLCSREIVLAGVTVPSRFISSFIGNNDPGMQTAAGFMISPRFGISVDLEHAWISVFVRGRWDRFLK